MDNDRRSQSHVRIRVRQYHEQLASKASFLLRLSVYRRSRAFIDFCAILSKTEETTSRRRLQAATMERIQPLQIPMHHLNILHPLLTLKATTTLLPRAMAEAAVLKVPYNTLAAVVISTSLLPTPLPLTIHLRIKSQLLTPKSQLLTPKSQLLTPKSQLLTPKVMSPRLNLRRRITIRNRSRSPIAPPTQLIISNQRTQTPISNQPTPASPRTTISTLPLPTNSTPAPSSKLIRTRNRSTQVRLPPTTTTMGRMTDQATLTIPVRAQYQACPKAQVRPSQTMPQPQLSWLQLLRRL